MLTPLSLALGVAVPRIFHCVPTQNIHTSPEENTAPTRSGIAQTVCNKRLTEAQGFVVELHVDRKGLRDEDVNLCQKDVNPPNKEN